MKAGRCFEESSFLTTYSYFSPQMPLLSPFVVKQENSFVVFSELFCVAKSWLLEPTGARCKHTHIYIHTQTHSYTHSYTFMHTLAHTQAHPPTHINTTYLHFLHRVLCPKLIQWFCDQSKQRLNLENGNKRQRLGKRSELDLFVLLFYSILQYWDLYILGKCSTPVLYPKPKFLNEIRKHKLFLAANG